MSGLRKRVNVVRIKVTKTMIDEAVGDFVQAKGIQVILYRCILEKAPVIFDDKGCCHLSLVPTNILAQTGCGTYNLHIPLREMPLQVLELLHCMWICHHGLFLEVTDKTVTSPWGDNIQQDSWGRAKGDW